MKEFLPAAFYDLQRLDIKDEYDDAHCFGRPARWKALPSVEYRILLLGRDELRTWSRQLLASRGQSAPYRVSRCSPECAVRYKEVFIEAKKFDEGDFDVLHHLRGLSSSFAAFSLEGSPGLAQGPCRVCCKEVANGLREIREKI